MFTIGVIEKLVFCEYLPSLALLTTLVKLMERKQRFLSKLAFEIGISLHEEKRITVSFFIVSLNHHCPLLLSDSFIELYSNLGWKKTLKVIWSKTLDNSEVKSDCLTS